MSRCCLQAYQILLRGQTGPLATNTVSKVYMIICSPMTVGAIFYSVSIKIIQIHMCIDVAAFYSGCMRCFPIGNCKKIIENNTGIISIAFSTGRRRLFPSGYMKQYANP